MKERHLALARKLYGAMLYYSGVSGLCHQCSRNRKPIRILGYHQVDSRSFEAHLRYLIKFYRIVSLREVYLMLIEERPLQPSALALTFDDGHFSFYRQLFPLLQKYHVPAAVFIATDFVGTGKTYWFDWVDAIIDQTTRNWVQVGDKTYLIPATDRYDVKEAIKDQLKALPEVKKRAMIESLAAQSDYRASQVPKEAEVINWQQAAEMQASGLVDIGGHTCSHPILTRIPSLAARREIMESRRILQERLGTDVEFFAYPNGLLQDINQEIIGYVQEAGYLAAVTLIEGVCRPGDDPFTLKRISASGGFTYQTLAAKLSGLWPFIFHSC